MQTHQVAVLILAGLACLSDVRVKRIPNVLTFGGAALAVAYWLATAGVGGLFTSLGGWLTGVALFFPLFALGGMGAGDVKLAGCFGAWLGPTASLFVALYSALAGGVMALTVALASGYFKSALRNIRLLLTHWLVMGVRPLPELTLEGASSPRLPFALPLAVGALAAIWWR